jgi:hypothetical protein
MAGCQLPIIYRSKMDFENIGGGFAAPSKLSIDLGIFKSNSLKLQGFNLGG